MLRMQNGQNCLVNASIFIEKFPFPPPIREENIMRMIEKINSMIKILKVYLVPFCSKLN